jgi:hypothetical protein
VYHQLVVAVSRAIEIDQLVGASVGALGDDVVAAVEQVEVDVGRTRDRQGEPGVRRAAEGDRDLDHADTVIGARERLIRVLSHRAGQWGRRHEAECIGGVGTRVPEVQVEARGASGT